MVFAFVKFSGEEINSIGEVLVNEDKTSFSKDEVIPGEIQEVDEDTNTFIHKQYGFSLNYPSSLTVSNFREGDGELVLFQGDNGDWLQIYIMPWDEEGDITVERIKEDLPDLLILDPQRVIIGPKQKEGIGPNALIFFSQDSGLGETREVWFIYPEPSRGAASYLYQVTTYKRLDSVIGTVLSTLNFD